LEVLEVLEENVTDENDLHSAKHLTPKTSTDEGIIISTKPVPINARFSIHDNIDPDSLRTEESDPHKEKHSLLKTSTDERIIISSNQFDKMFESQFEIISILIQI
jgi:hypothetical protein